MSDSAGCVFCAIVGGEGEASRIYEDECVLVFLDIRPVTEAHLLVIPKKHLGCLEEVDEQTGMGDVPCRSTDGRRHTTA